MKRLVLILAVLLAVPALASEPPITLPLDGGGRAAQALRPDVSNIDAIGYSTNSVSSTTIEAWVARIVCTTDCYWSVSPTAAVVSSNFLPANTVEYIRTLSGTDAITVRQVNTAGTLYVTPMK